MQKTIMLKLQIAAMTACGCTVVVFMSTLSRGRHSACQIVLSFLFLAHMITDGRVDNALCVCVVDFILH